MCVEGALLWLEVVRREAIIPKWRGWLLIRSARSSKWLEPEDDEKNLWLDLESHSTPSVFVHVGHFVRLAAAVLWRVQSSLLRKLVAADWPVIIGTDVLSILLI